MGDATVSDQLKQLPWNHWHLLAPREPRIECCSHGRPEHQLMIRQLAEAMGYDLPAIAATPAQVWAGLLDEIERRFR
jgi:hypothetical protein